MTPSSFISSVGGEPPSRGGEALIVTRTSPPLFGRAPLQGSKNAALPLLAAMAVAPGGGVLRGAPEISDIDDLGALLAGCGVTVRRTEGGLQVSGEGCDRDLLPASLTARLRGAIYAAAAPLARLGRVRLGRTGGDQLPGVSNARHLRVLRQFGLDCREEAAYITVTGRPRPGVINVVERRAGITASALALTLAASCDGWSTLLNLSAEPEVLELCDYLRAAGASLEHDGPYTAVIRGPLTRAADWRTPPDRVAWATYAVIASVCGGAMRLPRPGAGLDDSLIDMFRMAEVEMNVWPDQVLIQGRPRAPMRIETGAFPALPSDIGPLATVLMAAAPGVSTLDEGVYTDRFDHIPALAACGLDADVVGSRLTIRGGRSLAGGVHKGLGIRETTALLAAALMAKGRTVISQAQAVHRGYEALPHRLAALGAPVESAWAAGPDYSNSPDGATRHASIPNQMER